MGGGEAQYQIKKNQKGNRKAGDGVGKVKPKQYISPKFTQLKGRTEANKGTGGCSLTCSHHLFSDGRLVKPKNVGQ